MQGSNITGRLLNARRVNVADGYFIIGNIYEDIHNRFNDGTLIWTSQVRLEECEFVYTLNSIYEIESWSPVNGNIR